jgi:hypothetical protein
LIRPGLDASRDRGLATLPACASAAYVVVTLRFGQLIGDFADFRVFLFGAISAGLALFGPRDAVRRPA